jgi:uncharacterized glyoxalase superfamily protein PhnB
MVSISPMLMYEHPERAIGFLQDAFGFHVPAGAEDAGNWLALGDATVSVWGVWREAGFETPEVLGKVPSQLWCEVADVDAHYERALAAGAVVVGPPDDLGFGFRAYRAVDPEGHRWFFGSPIRS